MERGRRVAGRAVAAPVPLTWALASAAGVAAIALGVLSVQADRHVASTPLGLAPLAAVCTLAELTTGTVRIRRRPQTYSAGAAVLAAGLTFSRPLDVIVAHALGTAVALLSFRRTELHRTGYAVASAALASAAGVLVFDIGAGATRATEPQAWPWVLAAGVVMATAASLLEELSPARVRRKGDRTAATIAVGAAAGVGLLAGCLGLQTSVLVDEHRAGMALAAASWLAILGLTRALIGQRERSANLRLLFEVTSLVQRAPNLEEALVAVLDKARATFGMRRALVVLRSGGGGPALQVRLGPGPDHIVERVDDERASRALDASQTPGEGDEPWCNGHVARLRSDASDFGIVAVGDRRPNAPVPGKLDRQLFAMLAEQLAVLLENGRLHQSVAQLSELERQLSHLAHHDALTGVANRRLFNERLDQRVRRAGGPWAVLLVDLDGFKPVNDTHGHATGDLLLRVVAQRVERTIREGDVVARLGGDEFAVLLAAVESESSAVDVADRIVTALTSPFAIGEVEVAIGASIGVAMCAGERTPAPLLLERADQALYEAKRSGKGRFVVWHEAA